MCAVARAARRRFLYFAACFNYTECIPNTLEVLLETRVYLLVVIIAGFAAAVSHSAQTQPPAALAGRITSAEEGAMEGVLVSAKSPGSVTITVVSDEQGRYSFPSSKLQPGRQVISV